MALDTRDRRASAVQIGWPWRAGLPLPDGLIDSPDRLHVAGLYRGLAGIATPSGPSATFLDYLERGGQVIGLLFGLSVTHPTPYTWYLSTADRIVGGTHYRGLVRDHSGIAAFAALGGVGGEAGITLTLANALGTGEPGRRFMDVFVEPLPAYGQPYDLLTATLETLVLIEALPGEPLRVGGSLQLQPDGIEWVVAPGEPERVILTFGPDQRRYRTLPRVINTTRRYPHLPVASDGQPRRPWFGSGLRVPLLPVDADGGLYEIGASPTATPLRAVRQLWAIRPDVEGTTERRIAVPVRQTTAGEVLLSIAGDGTPVTLTQAAQRFRLDGQGGFSAGIRLWLRRASAGTPCVGSISVSVGLDADALPGDTLVDPAATAEVNAAIVATGTFAPHDLLWQQNELARAALLPPDKPLWAMVRYAKTSGNMEIEVHAGAPYAPGLLATRSASGDDAWKPVGRKRQRGPVAQDFRGLGWLRRTAADGTIARRPPAKGRGKRHKTLYVGVVDDGGVVGAARAFARWQISDLPASPVSARIDWYYHDKANPTGNVSLIEVADPGTLDAGDWGAAERATITTSAITPSTPTGTRLSIDVTTRYTQAKTDGLSHFAVKLQYATESQGVGAGRWYEVGGTGGWVPRLVLTLTTGQDLRMELIATPVTVDLARPDELGTPAAAVVAGDGNLYPPLGPDVELGATIDGLQDDAAGTYTGTPAALIDRGSDVIRFLYRSPDEGCGMTAAQVHEAAFATARTRLADWFPLAGGLVQVEDVRTIVARIARACRAVVYLDQHGFETIHVAPLGGSGATAIRLVRPDEHGRLVVRPAVGLEGALYPVSRLEVFYARDLLQLDPAQPWLGHVLIAPGETEPPDPVREAQAADAVARYGIRELADVPTPISEATGYEWVPLDAPGTPTGLRLLQWLWDTARARPWLCQELEIELPRYALGWRLMQEFELESYHFPSAGARGLRGADEAYQARRARCQVRALPRLRPESHGAAPVLVTALILGWDTP